MPTTDRRRTSEMRATSRGTRRDTSRRIRGHRLMAALGAAVLVISVLMLFDQFREQGLEGRPRCTFSAPDGVTFDLSPEQSRNAAVIAAAATRRGLPTQAATIGIATAMQESKLRNLRGGDRDSVGLFQQRPSQGWGTPNQILDPVYASDRFYQGLATVSGWQDLPLTQAAQSVQRSGFPDAYARHETEAQLYGDALTGVLPESIGCRIESAESGLSADQMRAQLQREIGLKSTAAAGSVVLEAGNRRAAATAAAWAVASAQEFGVTEVTLGSRMWRRGTSSESLTWSKSATAAPGTTVRIALARR